MSEPEIIEGDDNYPFRCPSCGDIMLLCASGQWICQNYCYLEDEQPF